MNVTIELPKRVKASDYHEFDDMSDYLKKIHNPIKVLEIGFSDKEKMYVGIVYVGNVYSDDNRPLYTSLLNECKG